MVRDARSSDYKDLRPLFDEVHKLSPYAHAELDEPYMRRMFSMAAAMPNFFFQVSVDGKDRARGLLAGHISPNVWGVNVATDILSFSKRDTGTLIKNFRKWAKEKGAEFVTISEVTGNPRYKKLICNLGFDQVGTIFSGGY